MAKLTLLLLALPTMLLCANEDPMEDYDDDAFLSAKTAASEHDGLVGWSLFSTDGESDRYIINFNNVSAIEYIRFVSRISNINFQLEEEELDFPITLISEEPLSVPNILSALIQTLRARGFLVLERDNNLMITKSREIRQIPTIVGEGQAAAPENAPIVTRVFRVDHGNLASIAEILRPMMSEGSVVDVLAETRQLIVTDITTNVEQVGKLLESLDSPHSNLDIDIYKADYVSVEVLAKLGKEILAPFSKDIPVIFVPQTSSNSLFIVSNPFLIDKAIEVFEDLDQKPSGKSKSIIGDTVFIYPIQNKTGDEMLTAIENIAEELEGAGSASMQLLSALENARYIEETNSLLFITTPNAQTKLMEILASLDVGEGGQNYYIYKLVKANRRQVEESLDELAKSLKKDSSSEGLVNAIRQMRFLEESNSFIFTGSPQVMKQLEKLLPTFDIAVSEFSASESYWLYTPVYLNGKELERALDDLEGSLSSSGFADRSVLYALKNMKWVPSTNTLLFTGDIASLEHIKAMIKLIDVPSSAQTKILFYMPKYVSYEQIEEALDELADKLDTKNLSDRNLAAAIDDMTWVADSQAFLFKADPGTIAKIEDFLKEIDSPREAEAIAQAFFLYTLKFVEGEDIIDQLEKIAKNLPHGDIQQVQIAKTIDTLTYLSDTNSILITGTTRAVEEVKNLIAELDSKSVNPRAFVKSSFFVYEPVHMSPYELERILKETAADLEDAGLMDPSLIETLDTMRVVDTTGSIVLTGTPDSLEKAKELIEATDRPGIKGHREALPKRESFFVYKVKYVTPAELLRTLENFAVALQIREGGVQEALIKSLRRAKILPDTNSILFTGTPAVLKELEQMVRQLDVPALKATGREVETYLIFKPKKVSGPELIEMMHEFEQNLMRSGVKEPGLFQVIDHLKYIEKSGYILISGPADQVEKVHVFLQEFDNAELAGGGITPLGPIETSFLIYKLQYHQGEDLLDTLKTVGQELSEGDPSVGRALLNAINSIQWIKVTNSLLATGAPETLTQLKELIENIDTPLRQVFIEVLIIQTSMLNNQQFGLQWGGKVQYLDRFGGGYSNFPSPNPPSSSANQAIQPALAAVNATRTPLATDIPNPSSNTGGFDLGVIGDIILHRGKSFLSLASLVNALQQDKDSVVVLNPKIIAQDGQQSTIFVGQNIPFVGSTVSTVGQNSQQTTSNIEYRDVGINLSITPTLGTGDMVTMTILNEITSQVDNTVSGSAGTELTGLQTSRTSLNASVIVPNKHFVALSGVIQDTKSHFKSGIPCLGGLPVIGAVFSSNNRANSRENVIFFLRPVIIDSVAEYKKITDNQEALYKELGVKQIVKEEIDEGIDWVKTPDDE